MKGHTRLDEWNAFSADRVHSGSTNIICSGRNRKLSR